jgi:hypothetical protein
LKNRNTAILAVPASGRPDRFYEAVEMTMFRHQIFNRLLERRAAAH